MRRARRILVAAMIVAVGQLVAFLVATVAVAVALGDAAANRFSETVLPVAMGAMLTALPMLFVYAALRDLEDRR